MIMETFGLFVLLLGFIVGFGSVIVIDFHGFLARKSSYWTEATIRTHKITKPLIWTGIILVSIGGFIFYPKEFTIGFTLLHLISVIVLILNGIFLSFIISPKLLKREREGKAKKILSSKLQNKIAISMIISDIGWITLLFLLVTFLI
jgi:hypothetical protein